MRMGIVFGKKYGKFCEINESEKMLNKFLQISMFESFPRVFVLPRCLSQDYLQRHIWLLYRCGALAPCMCVCECIKAQFISQLVLLSSNLTMNTITEW